MQVSPLLPPSTPTPPVCGQPGRPLGVWVELIGVCRFDIEKGHMLEWYEPCSLTLSQEEATEIAFSAMPDTEIERDGDSSDKTAEYSFRCTFRGQDLQGWVRFCSRDDPSQPRGAVQRSVVLLSALPFSSLWMRLLRLLLKEHMARAQGVPGDVPESDVATCLLATVASQMAQWPQPLCCGCRPTLPMLGTVLTHVAPCFRQRGYAGTSLPPPVPGVCSQVADDDSFVWVGTDVYEDTQGRRSSIESGGLVPAEAPGSRSFAPLTPATTTPRSSPTGAPRRGITSSIEGDDSDVIAAADISDLLTTALSSPHWSPRGPLMLGGAAYAFARLAVNIAQAEARADPQEPSSSSPVAAEHAVQSRQQQHVRSVVIVPVCCPAAQERSPLCGGESLSALALQGPRLWKLWELALIGEPIAVIAPDAAAASGAALAIASLIDPLPYGGYVSPFLTLHSAGADAIARAGEAGAAVIAGAANPFFVQAWQEWPNLVSLGKGGRTWDGSPGASRHHRRRSRQRGRIAHAPITTLFSDRRFSVHYDAALLTRARSLREPAEQFEAALRSHFRRITCEFVEPMLEVVDAALAAAAPSCFADRAVWREWRELLRAEGSPALRSLNQHPPPFADSASACINAATRAGLSSSIRWTRWADVGGMVRAFVQSPNFVRFLLDRYCSARREWILRHHDLPSLLLSVPTQEERLGALDVLEEVCTTEEAACVSDLLFLERLQRLRMQVPEFRVKLTAVAET
eukprot:TRINITY_DN20652_c0_g1_i1.p1 TRINITY_DN20652_c0_g1~~TRINITY_DN20652_c0_g1_i1.p1  ORF type:complete len:744 (+),score=168.16 TRINITY_DN20652_c0_g1_i1:77-2308(+)